MDGSCPIHVFQFKLAKHSVPLACMTFVISIAEQIMKRLVNDWTASQ
jgi:hypothetical protein